jgi:hypothetical protein
MLVVGEVLSISLAENRDERPLLTQLPQFWEREIFFVGFGV